MQSEQQLEIQVEELEKLQVRLRYHFGHKIHKPFYIWNDSNHDLRYKNSNGNCCFHHLIGPPQKDNRDMPLLPYQQLLWNFLKEHKRIWIKKSRGIGVTEFLLRYIAYNCSTGGFPAGSRVCIVTGPRIDLAEDLISRFKGLFLKIAPKLFDRTQSTVAILNHVLVEAFPSHHVDTMRGLTNVKFIMSDESDYYPPFQQKEVRAVMEGYIGKPNSDPHILLVSTPKAPGGLMQQIEQEKDSLYYKFFLDYHYGLEGPQSIYSQAQINEAKKRSPDFPREYELQYQGLIGNVFNTQSIERCQKIEYDPDEVIPNCKVSIGIDPGFGTFGIVATRFVNNRIEIVVAEDHKDPDFGFPEAIRRIWEIRRQLGDNYFIYCDAANPVIWKELKRQFNERPYDNKYVFGKLAEYEKNNWDINSIMRIVPVPFSNNHAQMLQHAKSLFEDPRGLVAIDKRFDKLLTALRTAVAEEYKLKKEETSYNDVLDAFRLSLQYYRRNK